MRQFGLRYWTAFLTNSLSNRSDREETQAIRVDFRVGGSLDSSWNPRLIIDGRLGGILMRLGVPYMGSYCGFNCCYDDVCCLISHD